jgi:hypothetical protein
MNDEQQLRERLLVLAIGNLGANTNFSQAWAEEMFDYIMSGKITEAAQRAYESRNK